MARHAFQPASGLVPRALAIPLDRSILLTSLDHPSHVKRSPAATASSSAAATTSCGPNDTTGICTRPVSSTTTMTLPIVLGAAIPITCAIIAFFFLHRRHVKKLRLEDANDKHKSLDFGLDFVPSGSNNNKRGNGGNGGLMGEKSTRQRAHGVSLDLTMGNPYLLPPVSMGSHESIHSLSKSLHGGDDKYRHAAAFPSSENRFRHSVLQPTNPLASEPRSPLSPPGRNELTKLKQQLDKEQSVLRKSNNYLGALIQRGDAPSPEQEPKSTPPPPAPITRDESSSEEKVIIDPPKAHDPAGKSDLNNASASPRISLPLDDDKSDYGDASRQPKEPVPQLNIEDSETPPPNGGDKPPSPSHDIYDDYYDAGYQVDTRRLTVGVRPLPPEDPSDNPEQRANRIRSFYKEYFDETKPQEDYYEDYVPETTGYGAYDPYGDQGYYQRPPPFMQPEGRRAMTPPPRMPQIPAQYRRPGPGYGPPSNGSRSGTPSFSSGPRAFSSASNRMPVRGPRKPQPPPSPLHVLPTPHKLKDDSITPIEFAPGTTSRERRAGRPETPHGGLKPYMLTVPAHVPLASSYDDLAILPSPHALRKSGAFTALDFVPPSRFKNSDFSSDAGSIRSNRTGISAAQAYSIRTGAYRLSRLPPQTVGTKDDIISNLKPTWDMKT
ncbi:predicted protein [Uncinocarpus reesii 1704]|uniref:Uncharacterized protein n=1 Tax=Uncinocarpus reesii (strain UAMH 1704) TaxID=336963 RepID=C4JT60_UNCRE|nr:uncharacterized protein UREG_05649 [Uncinocarpus reesii 1704]EEP80807.1 predicted protein [Uncinocarpus reesii 1704]